LEIDPLEQIQTDDEDGIDHAKLAEKRKSGLNAWVAITVALLATFMGICNVKDGNIVQSMQQAQAKSIDDWSYYQARNIRGEVAQATVDQLQLAQLAAPPTLRAQYDAKIKSYRDLVTEQITKKKQNQTDAIADAKQCDALNYHDDQFDLSDALTSIAISLFAVTSLTQKRALFFFALIPTFFGILMGLAGLLGWHIHSNLIANWLS
jgi:hypothetical protein